MKRINGGVTAPLGFLASGLHCGIKATPCLDLALIVSEQEGSIAGVFTKNKIPAAPVTLDRLHLKKQVGRAILVNSGNANACTGIQGQQDARTMASLVASQLNIPHHQVFVGSTGVIGPCLPMKKIQKSVPLLMKQLRKTGHRDAAAAIMTTDTRAKEVAIRVSIGGKQITIGGMAKGSGMIHPNMATMLGYITTDASITPTLLQASLNQAVDSSFNCISVDGETSTNDTVLCLANGMANNSHFRKQSTEYKKFQEALNYVCHTLAMKICQDGEGATKVVELLVHGAKNHLDAKQIANTVATSPLVKTALFGEDPNWGRLLMAIGRAEVPIQEKQIQISLNGVKIVENGMETHPPMERQAQRVMRQKNFSIHIIVGKGKGEARVWTTDLSYDYIKINASYRS